MPVAATDLSGSITLPSRVNEHGPGRLLGRHFIAVSWLGVVIAFVHPPHGTGLTICWMKATTGIRCPGCGLTRSVSCAARGMVAESWSYHPFGIAVLALFAAVAVHSLLPRDARLTIDRLFARHARPLRVAYALSVALFIAYGVARALTELGH